MKKKITVILALVMAFIFTSQIIACASGGIVLYNNNTLTTTTIFNISDTGSATVYVDYEGYNGITTGATITTVIQKKVWVFFWQEVTSWVDTPTGFSFSTEHQYQLDSTGTYKCTVEYVISGTGGADDVIGFEDSDTY